jgi:transcription antitermination factor NusG
MPWFVGRTRPCCEHIAQRQIERHLGVLSAPRWNDATHTYLPMFLDKRNRRRQCLFTGWLFIRQREPYAFLFHIEALAYLLMQDKHPAVLKDAVIGEWRNREDRRGLVRLPERRFEKGDAVKVIYGPLKDQTAIYQGMSANERASVLLAILGKETKATIDAQALVKA